MNSKSYKKSYRKIFALFSALLASCSVKCVARERKKDTKNSRLLIAGGTIGIGAIGAAALYYKYGWQKPKTPEQPETPEKPELPSEPAAIISSIPEQPKLPNEQPTTPISFPSCSIVNNGLAPALSDDALQTFKANFAFQCAGKTYTQAYIPLEFGFHDGMENFELEYPGSFYARSAPDNYVDRVAMFLPLLGKKYTGSNSDNDTEITNYIIDAIPAEKPGFITVFTVPEEGKDKDKIWMVVDGLINNEQLSRDKMHNIILSDTGTRYIVVKANGKNMQHKYTNLIKWSDGDWIGSAFKVFKHGNNKGVKKINVNI